MVAWCWGLYAGFRSTPSWGFLNMLFYPVTPLVYGFHVRKDLGRRAAIMVLGSFVLFIGAAIFSAVLLS